MHGDVVEISIAKTVGGIYTENSQQECPSSHQKWNNHPEPSHKYAIAPTKEGIMTQIQGKGKGVQNKPSNNYEDICYHCGMKDQWSRTCPMPKHLIDLYQRSENRGRGIEVNFRDQADRPSDDTYLEAEDYIIKPDETFDLQTDDGNDRIS